MAGLLRLLQHRKARQASASALQGSASVPVPASGSTDNSQAASEALIELAHNLDDALQSFDFAGEPSDQLQLQLERLSNEAAKYSNSQIDKSTGSQWTCTRNEAVIVAAANACSAMVYDPEGIPEVPDLVFKRLHYLPPSIAGTEKAVGVWSVEQPSDKMFVPFVVVAVKGTKNVLDAMVNLNGKKQSTIGFINSSQFQSLSGHQIHAHAGFANSARAIIPRLSTLLFNTVSLSNKASHIVFAGHSAGGAVASLLFAYYTTNEPRTFADSRLSLVTFGAPPTVDIDLTPHLKQTECQKNNPGLLLSFVNEFDAVVRADPSYLRSLVNLYQSVSRQGISQLEKPAELNSEVTLHNGKQEIDTTLEKRVGEPEARLWPLTPPDYHPIGDIVVLKVSLGNLDVMIEGGSPPIILRAVQISEHSLASVVFCGIEVHSRVHYTKRVQMLLKGKFNGDDGWDCIV